jgi:two-component system chemotaxis response regulator CheB
MGALKVLVVDDSTLIRGVLARLFTRAGLEVVGAARDPYEARDMILRLEPEVITLDLEMPRMDGLTFLERLMMHHPLPVVVLSALAQSRGEMAMRALELGAIAVLQKPEGDFQSQPDGPYQHLVEVVKTAGRSNPRRRKEESRKTGEKKIVSNKPSSILVALGASLGGTEALQEVLSAFPGGHPGLVVVQHMPAEFTGAFARRLDKHCLLNVREAREGDWVMDGLALVAPGGKHMVVKKEKTGFRVGFSDAPPLNHVKPSVDVLFQSVAEAAGPRSVGAILTGMGKDGAEGLLAMRQAGAFTLGQDEESCVVYGMPKEAVERGAVERVVPLSEMAGAILEKAFDNHG